MRNVEISVPNFIRFNNLESMIESSCTEIGLTVARKTTLKQYPGCVHWHLKRGKEKGTLEITLWPAQQRLWLCVHENRTAAWIESEIDRLKTRIENPA